MIFTITLRQWDGKETRDNKVSWIETIKKWCGDEENLDLFIETVFTTHKLQLAEKDKEIERLRDALGFYANEDFHNNGFEVSTIEIDNGDLARRALDGKWREK